MGMVAGAGVWLALAAVALAAIGFSLVRISVPRGVVIDRGEVAAEAENGGGAADSGRMAGADAQDDADAAGRSDTFEGPQAEEPVSSYVVHVDGAVKRPGLVRLEGSDLRVADAIDACGGLAKDAQTQGVNLAEPLIDGSKIFVPGLDGEEGTQQEPGQSTATVQEGTSRASQVPASASPAGLINLNTADATALQQLSGVGEVTARAIVEDREANGPFASVDDLMRVSGIGEKKLARIREQVCV
jgi:competence protein ComEA